MASSFSIFSPQVNLKHDVFLSFRGEDTRETFTSHLNAALNRRKIRTYIDYQLRRGDEISSSLLNAIKESKISVIIFSEGYASSRWCLEELVKILECRKTNGQIVIPVFYRVYPSDIRNQTGPFGDGFAQLKERFKDKLEMLQIWRDALTEAANLSGFNSLVIRPESLFTEKIVDDILKRLNNMSPTYSKKDLVGLESKIQYILNLLCIGSNDVSVVGIWGIGGIGKTTLANAVFNKISYQFEAFCFIENVREASEKGGLIGLQKELLSTILEDENANIRLTFTKERLNRKKVLIVFDDVTCVEQIKELIGEHTLASGSRIMITTRDKQVLRCCGLNDGNIYQVEGLCNDDSLQLFRQYAFRNIHPTEDYMKLSNEVVKYAQGVPLAIKVLGSFLLGRTVEEWESELDKLKKYPHMNIQKVLQISYEGLDYEQKNIFLDIVFFFKRWDQYLVEEILNACDFSAQIGISVLIDRALITISCNTITMHDLLQEMGREIVRQESVDNPGKRSRLWHHRDIHRVLTTKRGTDTIRGLCFDTSEVEEIRINPFASSLDNLYINPYAVSEMDNLHIKPLAFSKMDDLQLNPLAFSEMDNLRFLTVYNSKNMMNIKVHGFGGLEFDSRELRYIYWDEYPDRSLPTNFNPENLVLLKMPNSNLKQLWDDCQTLANLKYIDLSHSHSLLKIPDLSRAPNLKSLELEGCTSLFEITPPLNQSFGSLVKLNLRNCTSLRYLPIGIQSKSLRFVNLSGCSNLKTAPKISCNMEELCLDGTGISEFSSSIEYAPRLVLLNLKNCSMLEYLPSNICELKALRHLILSGCSILKTIPKMPCYIEELYLDETAIKELPSSIGYLSSVIKLSLENCLALEGLPNSICKLKSLKYLNISGCPKLDRLPEDFGDLESLEVLTATGIAIKELPSSIQYLSNAIKLNLENCSALEGLPGGISKLKSLKYLNISGCLKIDRLPEDFGDLESLEVLKASGIAMGEVPSSILCLKKLHDLSFEIRCNSQEFVDLISPVLSSWQFIRSLNLNGCGIRELPNSLDQLSSLRDLELAKNDFEGIPASIINLSNLWLLDVSYCKRLQSLPLLPCNIQDLRAEVCNSLRAVSGLIIPSNFYYNGTLSFINSFNLDQNALRIILNDALLKMYSDTILWLEFAKDGLDKPSGCICFPGSEIPEWFKFQSSGFSIKLPQGSFNHNFLGFFFCTVIQFPVLLDGAYSGRGYWHVEYELNLNINHQFKTVSKRRFPVRKPSTVVSSDHVFLWYNCNTFDFREFIHDTEAIINFNFINEWHHRDLGYVKKSGVHLFYTQESKEPMSNSTRFFILDEEEEQSSSRCGMRPEYGKEVEAFNQITNQSSSFNFLDSNKFSQNFVESTVGVITTSDQNHSADGDGEDNGSGNRDDERESKRLKRYQILRHGEALSCSFVGWTPTECD